MARITFPLTTQIIDGTTFTVEAAECGYSQRKGVIYKNRYKINGEYVCGRTYDAMHLDALDRQTAKAP